MKHKKNLTYITLIVSCLIIALTLPTQAASLKLKLFILAGQSNMVGYGSNINDLSPEFLEPQTNVLWYKENDQNNQWKKLQLPTEPLSFSDKVVNQVGFGPEISLGKKIASELNQPVAIVKYAKNGTSLTEDWQPGSKLYNSMVERVNKSISDFSEHTFSLVSLDIAGFFWMQGEKDALNQIHANNYETNLTNFIQQIRTDFNKPNLPFIIGKIPLTNDQKTDTNFGINGFYPYAETVRQAQYNISQTVPYTGIVETLDLLRTEDNLHLNSQGLIDLGARFADEWENVAKPCTFVGLLFFGVIGIVFGYFSKALTFKRKRPSESRL